MLISTDALKVVFVIDSINGNNTVMSDDGSSEMTKTDHSWVVRDAALGMGRRSWIKI